MLADAMSMRNATTNAVLCTTDIGRPAELGSFSFNLLFTG